MTDTGDFTGAGLADRATERAEAERARQTTPPITPGVSREAHEQITGDQTHSHGGTTHERVGNIRTIPSPAYGTVYFPMVGADIGDIQSFIGDPRIRAGGVQDVHDGVDIFAPAGTPIVAAVGGTVVAVGDGGLGGLRVAIRDQYGHRHYYAHLQGFADGLAVGQYVDGGTVIGYNGNTGNARSTPPHLHYSINEGTSSPLIDPMDLFRSGNLVEVPSGGVPTIVTGQPNTAISPEDPREDLTPEEALDLVVEEFPSYVAFMEVPELRDIFVDAVREGWAPERLQNEIEQTTWWQETDSNQRRFLVLQKQDPATYQTYVDSAVREVTRFYGQLGLPLPETEEELRSVAENFLLTFGNPGTGSLDRSEVFATIAEEAAFSATDPTPSGLLGDTMQEIRSFAAANMVRLTDRDLFQMAQGIQAGTFTVEGAQDFIRDTARARWAHDAGVLNALDNNLTVSQAFSAQRDQIASVLALDPDAIDFMDRRYAEVIDFFDGETRRAMTTDEAWRWARSQPEARQTREFQRDAAGVLNGLQKTFGLI